MCLCPLGWGIRWLPGHCCMGDAYVIVYSVTDKGTEKASELRVQLRRARQTGERAHHPSGQQSDLVRSAGSPWMGGSWVGKGGRSWLRCGPLSLDSARVTGDHQWLKMSRKKTQRDGRAYALPQVSRVLSAGEGTRCTRGDKAARPFQSPPFCPLCPWPG